MPQPNFTGSVTVKLYFGTKFDYFNIPYNQDLLRTTATRTVEFNTQAVWQTTFLTGIRLNFRDYQDVVGAQWAEIIDTGATNQGAHWYLVMGYRNVSKKAVEMGLLYDPVLSLGIRHITGIIGTLKRWSVDDDTHFKYIHSPEPINQIDKQDFYYYRYSCADPETAWLGICGFPYDMTEQPQVIMYYNKNGAATNIYYPTLEPPKVQTQFISRVGKACTMRDGYCYYYWNPLTSNIVFENYNYAIGLGFDLASNAYMIPSTPLLNAIRSNEAFSSLEGRSIEAKTGFGLYDATKADGAANGYNNAKAAELGTFFTLYNEVSGESVTVPNYDLNGTDITIGMNPYSNGFFGARFNSYLKDVNGYSGIVKSALWQPLTITSIARQNEQINRLTNVQAHDILSVGYDTSRNTLNTERENIIRNRTVDNYNAGYQTLLGGVPMISTSTAVGTPQTPSAVDPLGGSRNILSTIGNLTAASTHAYSSLQSIETSLNNLDMQTARQRAILYAQGNMGQIAPPAVKFADTYSMNGAAYDFIVRKTTMSYNDKQRADMFFTAYGYNVDNTILDNPAQLDTRQRFTFIQADDVQVLSVSGNTDLTRLRDFDTMNAIKQRFSTGIRIWKIEPDYDWRIANPIN